MQMMHLFRSKALSWVAVLLLMAATASPALARMTCVISGNTVLSWGQLDDCCPSADDAQATISATCCQVDLAKPQRADFTPAGPITLPVPAMAVMPWPVLVPMPLQGGATAVDQLRGPPAWPGSQCLSITGIFRI